MVRCLFQDDRQQRRGHQSMFSILIDLDLWHWPVTLTCDLTCDIDLLHWPVTWPVTLTCDLDPWPWPLTLTFNSMRAMLMAHTLAKNQRQRSFISKARVETDNRRTNKRTNEPDWSQYITHSRGKYENISWHIAVKRTLWWLLMSEVEVPRREWISLRRMYVTFAWKHTHTRHNLLWQCETFHCSHNTPIYDFYLSHCYSIAWDRL